jgi:uncharacterized protein YdaU (DUF1376 family)
MNSIIFTLHAVLLVCVLKKNLALKLSKEHDSAVHTFVNLLFLDENNDISHKTLQKRLFTIKNGKASMTQRREEVL